MASVNERLRDAAIDHSVDLAQYSEHVVRRMIGLLNRVDADLADELRKALDRLPQESFTVERLEKLLGAVRELNAAAYDRIGAEMTTAVSDFAEVEADYQTQLLTRVIPSAVQVHYPIAEVTAEQVRTAALSRPFQGRLLKDWARKMPADRMDVLRNAVRMGYLEGQSTSQIVARVIGSAKARKQDGAFQRSRRDLTAVVHTAITHTAAVARDRFQAVNSDLLEAVVWSSTLDLKTSDWCRIRDQKRYTVKTHKPIDHNIPWLGGPGKIHFFCRSTSRPEVKKTGALELLGRLPPAVRASMDGPVEGDLNYGEWLAKQSQARQEEAEGAVRAKLMRDGDLPWPKLYDAKGQRLSLDELRRRNAAAFERAGL
jgi:hypothetical protein